jgi:hypothetical protein
MLNLQPGDRIELFYEGAPATKIRATVDRLLTSREEGMGIAVEDYAACWIEIIVDEPTDMDASQVVLLNTDFHYRLNGRRVTLRKCEPAASGVSSASQNPLRKFCVLVSISTKTLGEAMSHHYSGPEFGFPHGDTRLDFTDLYAFQRTVEGGTLGKAKSQLPQIWCRFTRREVGGRGSKVGLNTSVDDQSPTTG